MLSAVGKASRRGRPYRIDFALTVLAGNLTRYRILRPLVEQDDTVRARWYPIRTWMPEDWLRFLPGALRIRARHLIDGRWLFLRAPGEAVVMHVLEIYYLFAILDRVLRRRTVLVHNSDGEIVLRHGLQQRLLEMAIRRTCLFVFFSRWAAERTKRDFPHIPDQRIVVLHPGINLDQWPLRPPRKPGTPFRLLFVAGNAMLKGLDTLLDAFETYLQADCALDVATQTSYLPDHIRERINRLPDVTLHLDLTPGSELLRRLYREADAFVLPTNGDVSSWVAIEAMATGLPVIICSVGGIPEIVRDGETGLIIPPRDPRSLAAAVERLRTTPVLQEELVARGRAHVEANFDARTNTQRLLMLIKDQIDAGTGGHLARRGAPR